MKFFGYRILPCALFLACLGVPSPAQDQPPQQHVGRVLDWSYHHLTLSGGLPAADLERARVEPRILFRLAERNLYRASLSPGKSGDGPGRDPMRPSHPRSHGMKIDWSVPLGTGIVAPYMFPAKYSFDINATPSCTNDYVVFGLNVTGTTPAHANLVGVNNLYSGAAPRLCQANPTVNWAYNGSTASGSVLTSPVISLDGKRIAYVESAAGSAVFHVLAWKAGQGTAATAAATPTLNGACTGTVDNPTSSCLKSVTFSSTATDTLSSPWVDYSTDKAFVGSDDGKIYRISCVFKCGLNTQPTVDWTFTLPVAGAGGTAAAPNGPVYDSQTGRLIVGDQLGELWTINTSGASPNLFAGPVMVGGGGCSVAHPPGRTGTGTNCTASGGSYGIPDSVLLDGSVGKIFAFSGNDGTTGASAVVAQLNENLTGLVRVHVGRGSVGTTIANWNLHSGAFDNAYFGATPKNGHLFLCGTGASDTQPWHYWIGFSAYPTMNSAPSGSLLRYAVDNLPCAPYSELFNPNITLSGGPGAHDLLVSGLMGTSTNGYIITNDITAGAITVGEAFVNYPGGVSGVIIDNVSSSGQASSVYFSTQGVVNVGTCANARCAVKLTQLDLQ
jgi:hypothetical protein